MPQVVRGAAVVAAGAGLFAAARRAVTAVRDRSPVPGSDDGGPVRWHSVTVYKDRSTIGDLPAPLAELGDHVEVRLETAPGGKGTEIHVRSTDSDGRAGEIRAALRRGKSLLETGEVLEPDRPGTSTPTPLNAPLRAATARGTEGGRL
jgi:hypothetical protein